LIILIPKSFFLLTPHPALSHKERGELEEKTFGKRYKSELLNMDWPSEEVFQVFSPPTQSARIIKVIRIQLINDYSDYGEWSFRLLVLILPFSIIMNVLCGNHV
jgi:hypothetical protein